MANKIAAFTVILVDSTNQIQPNHEVRVVTLTTKQGLPDDYHKLLVNRTHETQQAITPLLDLIFKYGQNDFQPSCVRSVSVGDIIVIRAQWGGDHKTCLYRVDSMGFTWLHDICF